MSIDGLGTLLTGLALLLAATTALAFRWDRAGRLMRTLLSAGVVIALAGTCGIAVNRLVTVYPSWSALLGGQPPPVAARQINAGGGTLQTVQVKGAHSGLRLPVLVYLPPGYSPTGPRLPVIEAMHGFPGTPDGWVRRLHIVDLLDTEIAAGRMAPTVVVMPYQTPRRLLDTECTNLAHGPQVETFLTKDVPSFVRDQWRVRTDRAGWALAGYSAGGFCAMNLLLRHPDQYAAAASLSGLPDPGIKVGDGSEHTTNNVAWRLSNLPQPHASIYLAWALDDKPAEHGATRIAALARQPLTVTTAVVSRGGHTYAAWASLAAPAFDWLSAQLARPQTYED